ncbi:hypothetical protein TNCV_4272631 [Trichonephila clavipes]|nr:hypothetical protein TNCV_4272631 [Trichonephila clavipes]
MEWHANSPDLNPIKHAWDALGRALARRQYPPNKRHTLKSPVKEEWGLLPQDEIYNLICSMRDRSEACIEATAARVLLATDHVILNHGQVTWTTHELASPSPNYHTTPTGGRFSSRHI